MELNNLFIGKITIFLFMIVLLTSCSNVEKSNTVEGTAKIFVQSLIDGDEEKFEQVNKNPGETTKGAMERYGPEFSGLDISDFHFETNANEVTISHGIGDKRIRYWLTIEKIGNRYFVTHY